jgi:DDE_Tnp_1-associated/Transposase DDE domain
MPVSHALVTMVTSAGDELPGLLKVLGRVPDPRRMRGRRYTLVFLLAVAVACVLAGAKNFREIGDQASDLPQEVLARLGGRPHPLRRTITAPSEKRIRTVLQEIDAATLVELTGGWLRGLADAGRLENLLRAIAIDGKWLRGIGDGQQVKLFAAMLHEEKVIIAQHAIPEDTNEITQVRELLDPVDLSGAVVTGDAAHAQRAIAAYIAGPGKGGGRDSDYFLFVKYGSCSSL